MMPAILFRCYCHLINMEFSILRHCFVYILSMLLPGDLIGQEPVLNHGDYHRFALVFWNENWFIVSHTVFLIFETKI